MKRPLTPESSETEELIRSIADKANLEVKQARVLWQIVCGEMAEHLAVHFKSIDLGFAVLHPCPYRVNWKDHLKARFPFLGQWIRGRSVAERDRIVAEAGVSVEMQETQLLAVRNGRVYFGLELVPKKDWWRYMLWAQNKLLAGAGPVGYCRGIGRIVSRLKERMLGAYLSHIHQVAIPCGRCHTGRYYNGQQYLVENRLPKKATPSSVPVRLGPLYQPNSQSEFVSSHVDSGVEKSNAGVLPMPDLRQKQKNVRACDTAELEQPGVPVLDAGEGQAKEGKMLGGGCGNGVHGGVA